MADGENKDLMEFLERQFEGIYKRLDNTATKDDLANFATKDDPKTEIVTAKDDLRAEIAATKDDLDTKITAAKEEAMRHTGVLIEDVKHKLDIVIEGVMGINEKMDRDRIENEQEHVRLEKMSLINSADISKLDQRVGRLEGRV